MMYENSSEEKQQHVAIRREQAQKFKRYSDITSTLARHLEAKPTTRG